MTTRLFAYLDRLRAAYWFIPAVMSLAAIVLSFVTTSFDALIGSGWLESVSWVYANKPEGARVVLSTIAGSMITVAGVVFSITIAAVSYASSQYGPRLLTNFMRDRGNQITLGTFIATFLYCLLVIRTVRNGDDKPPLNLRDTTEEITSAFVPNVAILTGIGLALCSIAVLIFFVHHVSRSIHISHVIADIGRELRRKIVQNYPLQEEDGAAEDMANDEVAETVASTYSEKALERGDEDLVTVLARTFGFVQAIDRETLVEVAEVNDLTVKLACRPGHFLQNNSRVMQVWPRANVTEAVANSLRATLICGDTRTPVQDLMFLVDELVEIAARALSPGVNDPFTAMNCLNWLGAAVGDLGDRHMPDPYWSDDDGRVRVLTRATTFESFADEAFGQLRPYVASDVNASLHMMEIIGEVSVPNASPAEQEVLKSHVAALLQSCAAALPDEDLERVRSFSAVVLSRITQTEREHVA